MKKLDRTDIAILNALQDNARITNAELARSVNLSPTPCFNRVKLMEELGVISRQVTLLEPSVLGLHVNVFIHVTLEKQVEDALKKFERAIDDRPEVMECYLMSGDFDYLLRVIIKDNSDYMRVHDKLTGLPGVLRVQSSFALRTVRKTTELALDN